MIEFRLLGTLHLTDAEGREVKSLLTRPRRLALLAYLAAATPRGFHRRDTLLALFWPELDQEHARAALRQALHVLRGAFGAGMVVTRGDEEIALNVDHLWCDVVAFDAAITAGRFGRPSSCIAETCSEGSSFQAPRSSSAGWKRSAHGCNRRPPAARRRWSSGTRRWMTCRPRPTGRGGRSNSPPMRRDRCASWSRCSTASGIARARSPPTRGLPSSSAWTSRPSPPRRPRHCSPPSVAGRRRHQSNWRGQRPAEPQTSPRPRRRRAGVASCGPL